MDNSNVEVTKLPIEGKIILYTTGLEVDSQEVRFYCADGSCYKMWHEQDCCESVSLNDISGDISVLECAKVLSAEEYSKKGEPDDYGTSTYTFYNIRTDKGYIQLKWYGESNGYYSEDVDFKPIVDIPAYHKDLISDIREKIHDILRLCDDECGYFTSSLEPSYISAIKDAMLKVCRDNINVPVDNKPNNARHYVCEHCEQPIGYARIYDYLNIWDTHHTLQVYTLCIDMYGNFYAKRYRPMRHAIDSDVATPNIISRSIYFNTGDAGVSKYPETHKFGAYCPRCGEKLPIDKPIYKGVI